MTEPTTRALPYEQPIRVRDKRRIPIAPDLRAYDLHGPCRWCGRSGREDDVHFASCPHQQYSDSMVVLEFR